MSEWSSDYWLSREEDERDDDAHSAIPRSGGGASSMSPPDEVAKARARATALTDDGLTREQRRSRRARRTGKMTENLRILPKGERRVLALLTPKLSPQEEALRPKTRGDCADGLRPCPWQGCRWHLAVDVTRAGNLTTNFPDLDFDEIPETCALDVADAGSSTREIVGQIMNVTRQCVMQLEERARLKIRLRLKKLGIDAEAFAHPKEPSE